jgi:tRNA pseudouridine38-40 synthase
MRVALGIEYDGTAYHGWQRQKNAIGIQAVVESAISIVADESIETICAGRTDAGVHATSQVVHFNCSAARSRRNWLSGINANLPDDINVTWAALVGEDFHARFSAAVRTYRYCILNRRVRSALNRHRAWWVHAPLDESAMQRAADHLLGEHDFSAFRAAACRASTPIRELFSLQVNRAEDRVAITVSGNAFLQHMVRNIAGVLVTIGKGDAEPGWARSVLESRDRTQAGIAAPAHGLTLIGVDYPDRFELA